MWTRQDFASRFAPPAIGMIHLQPLPGSPLWGGDMGAVVAAAEADADALAEGGFAAVMMENYHDIPFHPDRVPAVTVAAMTHVLTLLRRRFPDLSFGVNVLRNDVTSALGIAVAAGADFVRVNVLTGAAVTDQGTIEGQAWRVLRRRRELGADVGILADVRVKHARPLVERSLVDEAADLRRRGLADAVIVTGPATGAAADPEDLALLREALPDCPLLVGSGVRAETWQNLRQHADGCIVGTSLQMADDATGRRRVSPDLVGRFLAAVRETSEERRQS